MTTEQQKAYQYCIDNLYEGATGRDLFNAGWQAAIEWMSGELVKENAIREMIIADRNCTYAGRLKQFPLLMKAAIQAVKDD